VKITRRHLRKLIVETFEEEILVGQEIPEHLLKSWLVGSIDDDYKDLTGHRYGKENLARMDLNQLKDLHIAINYELETLASDERDEKELGADLAASEVGENLPSRQGMGRRYEWGTGSQHGRGSKIDEDAESFSGAMRMARGGSSPMKSRAHPDLIRLIKKGYDL